MALLRVEYSSKVLEMCTSFHVILPDEGDLSRCPVVYLLHGLSDNCTGWTRYTACERYARERGVVLVMPEVQRSFYIDCAYGLKYFTYVSQELPRVCQRMFGLSDKREYNYVMGLSMGGYGALKCALTYPDRYAGCGCFSGVTDLEAFLTNRGTLLSPGEITALLGPEHTVGPENDLPGLARKVSDPPAIYISCGEQDAHYPMNVEFSRLLTELGIVHQFDHREGGHSWDFWDQSIRDCFDYLKL